MNNERSFNFLKSVGLFYNRRVDQRNRGGPQSECHLFGATFLSYTQRLLSVLRGLCFKPSDFGQFPVS